MSASDLRREEVRGRAAQGGGTEEYQRQLPDSVEGDKTGLAGSRFLLYNR